MLLGAVLVLLLNSFSARGQLWTKGVVHYTINPKDYDIHSQDEIASTFAQLEKEICLKFFNTPLNFNATSKDKILYINNKEQRKTCPTDRYDFSGNIVDMVIGYKCVNQRDIARITTDMLRASVEPNLSPVNSFDLVKKFREKDEDPSRRTLLSEADHRYINGHYAHECINLNTHPGLDPSYRRSGKAEDEGVEAADTYQMTEENKEYYKDKLWPWGIVMFGVDETLRESEDFKLLKQAMTIIELATCLVFQEAVDRQEVLAPRNLLWFGTDGEDAPVLGFREGIQTLDLYKVSRGAAGHLAHGVWNLLRAAGVPMASNRPDRDNYLAVHWENVLKGKEHFLEKYPEAGWLKQLPYDFESVTHAPANFMCNDACDRGETTVQPLQDPLWQRTLSMGHKTKLSETDRLFINTIYGGECQKRFLPADQPSGGPMIGSEYEGDASFNPDGAVIQKYPENPIKSSESHSF